MVMEMLWPSVALKCSLLHIKNISFLKSKIWSFKEIVKTKPLHELTLTVGNMLHLLKTFFMKMALWVLSNVGGGDNKTILGHFCPDITPGTQKNWVQRQRDHSQLIRWRFSEFYNTKRGGSHPPTGLNLKHIQ